MTKSTGSKLSDLIGSLEIGGAVRFETPIGDGTLEAESAQPFPTQRRPMGSCIGDGALEGELAAGPQPTQLPYCHHIDDDTLKAAQVTAGPTQTRYPPCHFIGDIELETAAVQGPITMPPQCHHIDDDTLKAAQVTAGPTQTRYPPCHFIGDIELETAAILGFNPPTQSISCPTNPFTCRRIDDDTLKAAQVSAGPTQTRYPPCHFIGDIELETAAMLSANPPTHSLGCPTNPFTCHRIDDGALESAAVAGPHQTHFPYCPGHIEGDRA